MSTPAEIDTSRTHREQADDSGWATRLNVVFWALLFGTVVMIAADPGLRTMVADNAEASPFASEATFLTLMRVATFAFALLLALLQGWIYGLVFGAVTMSPRPRVLTSWSYVVLAQAPMVVVVGGAYLIGGADLVADVHTTVVRVLLGVASVLVYTYLVARHRDVERSRLIAFALLAAAVNTALLVLSTPTVAP